MAGYLDQYGAGEEQRLKIIKTVVISLAAVVIFGGIALFIFHNYRQEHQVKQFFTLLESGQYETAYQMWVRTDADRKGYSYSTFLQDWGPQGEHRDVRGYHIAKSRSCGSGVILTVDFGSSQQEKLWVERNALTIGYSAFPGCPPPR